MTIHFDRSRMRFAPLILLGGNLCAQSVWLPAPGRVIATPAYTFQTFDGFQQGSISTRLPSPLTQQTGTVSFEAGISASVAADVTLGYSSAGTTSVKGAGPRRDSGMTDTLVGLRWKFLDEERAAHSLLPILALRVGGVIQGTYTPNLLFSAGDGASGVETSLLFGKDFSEAGAGFYGDAGFRHRNQSTPDNVFGSMGVYKNVRRASLSFGYRRVSSLSGMDVGDIGYILQRLKVISNIVEAGIGVRMRGGHYVQLYTAKSVEGRNTGQKLIVGMATSFGFGLPKLHLQ
jgi:hypothetical protein